MEQAIQKAIEGGYNLPKGDNYKVEFTPDGATQKWNVSTHKTLLDPLFWQCLGKSLEWGGLGIVRSCLCHETKAHELMVWESQMHSFIDHLIAGKDIDSFFTQLLKK